MTNEILPFCPTDTGTNLLTEAEYTADADRVSGNKPGVASSKLNNKALRQSTFVASQFAQFLVDKLAVNVLDDGVSATLLAQIKAAFTAIAPIKTVYTANGTYTQSYVFYIATGSATAGATYTNDSKTFTVSTTVASGTVLTCKGTGAPLSEGTLTKASGTGDATLTFYAVRAPLYLDVTVVGSGAGGGGAEVTVAGEGSAAGGGGGGGTSLKLIPIASVGASETVTVGTGGAGGTAGPNAGSNGNSSSFGSHSSATGGTAGSGSAATSGTSTAPGGSGGVGSSGDINMSGGDGFRSRILSGAAIMFTGCGGSSFFGGMSLSPLTATGTAGKTYGGGGAGATNVPSSSAKAGGAGMFAGLLGTERLILYLAIEALFTSTAPPILIIGFKRVLIFKPSFVC